MLKITQHDIKVYIKHNLGFDQICEKHQCNKDELIRAINNVYESSNAAKVIKDIQRNTKQIEKNLRRTHKTTSEMRALEESHLTPLEECTQTIDTERLLHNLKAQESSLSATVIKLESEHKALMIQHRSNLKQLLNIRQRMDNIRKEFQSVANECEALTTSNNNLVDRINVVAEQQARQSETLQNLRQQIQSLETITICIYTDGRIELLDDDKTQLDDSGNEKFYHELISEESNQCQDLRLRDIKTIARLKAIIANSARQVEVLFDDNALESYYTASN